MFSLNQNFNDFLVTAVSVLLEKCDRNYTWAQDEATTTAALETILEFLAGPNPLCRYSSIYLKTDGSPDAERRHFSIYEARKSDYATALDSNNLWSVEHSLYTPATILRRQRLGNYDGIRNDADAWLTLRWERLHAVIHPDAHIEGRFELPDYKTELPWLNAQIGYLGLHLGWASNLGSHYYWARDRVINRIKALIETESAPPWKSSSILEIEETAIVAQFLFHRCTHHLLNGSPIENQVSRLLQPTLDWIVDQQSVNGSWAASPHITAHCIRALAEYADYALVYRSSVERAMRYLLSPTTIKVWNHLDTYEQIEVLLGIIQVARIEEFLEFTTSIQIERGFRQPTVFISYAGCDVRFAKEISKALEREGVPVWFAEWDIDYGDEIVEQIQQGLEATSAFVIVLSPDSVSRPWVRKEISAAFSQAIDGPGKLIIPLRYKECEIPSFLRTQKWIDFTNSENLEPSIKELVRKLKRIRKSRS